MATVRFIDLIMRMPSAVSAMITMDNDPLGSLRNKSGGEFRNDDYRSPTALAGGCPLKTKAILAAI